MPKPEAARFELRGLRVSYRNTDAGRHATDTADRNVVAVAGVDLSIAPGQALGLFGESGCGKSSLALSAFGLAGKTTTVAGEVLLDGERIDGFNEKQWSQIRGRKVGLVFQQPSLALHPLRSIGGQLRDVLRAHTDLDRKAIAQRSAELLEELELEEDHLQARPHQLSGGQQQRALLAIALAAEPSLLVADEPTAALDEATESAVLELVQRLQSRRGLSLLWISHDPNVLEHLCDRIAVMHAGRLVETGPSSSLLSAPQHPYSKELLSYRLARPLLPSRR